MNRQRGKFSMTVLAGFTLVLSACQHETVDVAQARYQQQATESLKRMTGRYSGQFRSVASSGRRGFDGGGDGGWEYGSPWGNGPWGGQVFHPRVDFAARRCVEMVRAIPPIRATYGRAMVTVARCLNRVVEERNFLLTWGYQQGDQSMQNMWGYGQAWPLWQPYNQYGQNYQQQFHPWLNQGWSPDSGE